MSEFVKNKKVCEEIEAQGATHGPNVSAKQEISKKMEMEDLRDDISPKLQSGQCHYIKPDNSRCEAYAGSESFYCYFHNPDLKEEREASRKKGGKERSRKAAVLPEDTPDRPLTTAADVSALLAAMINQVLRGQIDPRVSNSVSVLVGPLMKAHEQEQIERRLERVESIVAQKRANSTFASVPTPESMAFEFVKANPGGEA